MQYVNEFVAYFQAAYPTFLVLGKPLYQAAAIAFILGMLTSTPSRLPFVPFVATVAYLIADAVYPAIAENKEVLMPVFDKTFAYHAVTLYLIFILPIIAVFGLKTLIQKIRG